MPSVSNCDSNLFEQLNIRPIINCVGYATRVSGSCPHPDVVEAMAAAGRSYFEIDDLLTAASAQIAQATGAAAGMVTCGAAAALTLAAAACLSGNDPSLMDQLPDSSACPRNEIIYPAPGPFDYDHAIRLSGARLIQLDYRSDNILEQIQASINARTAAIGYVWLEVNESPSIDRLVELAHRNHLPLIVDAACALPPADNLTSFARRGADLIAFSGGKYLGGPQASGILCGREDLIRSAWVQMVDMDVRQGTWSLQSWIDQGWIARPPRHGIGRSMKVSKEAIVGVMAALKRFSIRDHLAEQSRWAALIDRIYQGLKEQTALRWSQCSRGRNGQPYPNLVIESGDRVTVRQLLLALRNRSTRIILAEDEQNADRAILYPLCLTSTDPDVIVSAILEFLDSQRKLTTA